MMSACASQVPLAPPPKSPTPVAWPPPLANALPTVTPDAPFRDHVPEPGPPITFVPPKIESFALTNGVKVLFVERHELPIVSVRVVARTGAGDIVTRPGVAAFMGAMLEQGTTKRTAIEISDAFVGMGATHASWLDWDSAQITAKVLSSQLDLALDLVSDIAQNPSFPPAEIDRLKARWLAGLQAERTSPVTVSSNAVAAALYGRAHPYGHSLFGTVNDAKSITRDEIARAYAAELAPSNVTLVVAGDVTRAKLAAKLETTFGAWKESKGPRAAKRAIPAPNGLASRIVIVDSPGATQSQIAVADVGTPFGAPDRDALSVMNAILGGMFSSRINLNLREMHAYTYDARSRFSPRHGAGPFTAGGAIARDATADAVREILREVDGVRTKDVTPEELADAKEHIDLGLPARFESVNDVTSALADLAVYARPLDEYAALPARVAAIGAADVRKAAETRLRPTKMRVVVVGDRATIEPSLRDLKLGPISVLDAAGDVSR
jgi:predicted Zn-dependent peptidase